MLSNKIISQSITKSGKTVSFRYPTIDDVEILKNYINKISLEKTFISFQGEQQTFEEEKKWLESKLENMKNKKSVIVLAFINDKLVGESDIDSGIFFAKHVGNFGITIDIDFRGDGIGELLMDLIIKEAIKNIDGLKIIKLEVFSNNPIAPNLYKKMGFIEYGRLPEGAKHCNNFIDELLMYKRVK